MARATNDLRLLLPTGGTLPVKAWDKRHRAILAILWAHVPGSGGLRPRERSRFAPRHRRAGDRCGRGRTCVPSFAQPPICAPLSRRFGLVTSSALLVHFSGGVIEFHFHFFVVVAIVTLYQDWTPFLLAIAYVLLAPRHHGRSLSPRCLQPSSGSSPSLAMGCSARPVHRRRKCCSAGCLALCGAGTDRRHSDPSIA